MATATEISTKALKRLGMVNAGESPEAFMISDCNDALSSMIAGWDCGGLVGETLPLASRFEEGVIAMLAVRMAENFGTTPGPVLMRDAERGEQQINAAFFPVPESQFDRSLLVLPSYCSVGCDLAITPIPEWEVSTEYGLNDRIFNGQYSYVCTTAGTSASSGGPTGTNSAITDGTAVWQFERVYGG